MLYNLVENFQIPLELFWIYLSLEIIRKIFQNLLETYKMVLNILKFFLIMLEASKYYEKSSKTCQKPLQRL